MRERRERSREGREGERESASYAILLSLSFFWGGCFVRLFFCGFRDLVCCVCACVCFLRFCEVLVCVGYCVRVRVFLCVLILAEVVLLPLALPSFEFLPVRQ